MMRKFEILIVTVIFTQNLMPSGCNQLFIILFIIHSQYSVTNLPRDMKIRQIDTNTQKNGCLIDRGKLQTDNYSTSLVNINGTIYFQQFLTNWLQCTSFGGCLSDKATVAIVNQMCFGNITLSKTNKTVNRLFGSPVEDKETPATNNQKTISIATYATFKLLFSYMGSCPTFRNCFSFKNE